MKRSSRQKRIEDPEGIPNTPWAVGLANSPSRACSKGFFTCDKGRLSGRRGRLASAPAKNIVKNIGFTTVFEKKLLWLQFGASSGHAAAATATFLCEKSLKTFEIFTFSPSQIQFSYKMNQK